MVAVSTLDVDLLAKDGHCSGNDSSAGVHDRRASGRRQLLNLKLTYWMRFSQVEGRRAVIWVESTAWARPGVWERQRETRKEERQTAGLNQVGPHSSFKKPIFLEWGCQKRHPQR